MNTIRIGDIDVRYHVEGSGPWVTLSHSLTADLGMWDGVAAALADRHTVLRFDTRGHGGSSAPEGPYSFDQLTADVIGLLDGLGVERTDFVGLSMGGMIGQHLALAAPHRLGRLVIANSTSRTPPEMHGVWQQRIAQAMSSGTASLADATLERWFTPAFRAANPGLMARVAATIAATPAAGYAGCAAAISQLDLTARLVEVTAPTLVIAGAEDPSTPVATAQAIVAAIPGARLEIIPAASHLSCLEQPQIFHRLVADFLDG